MSATRCTCAFCQGASGNTGLYIDDPSATADYGSAGAASDAVLAMGAVGVDVANGGAVVSVVDYAFVGAIVTPSASLAANLPSWVASLSNAQIRSDMTAATADGVIGYSDLTTLFGDISTALKAGQTTLTASQFDDLKAIVANLNTDEIGRAHV